MDMEFPVDLSECLTQIKTSDVLTVCFPMLRKTLLVDLRVNSRSHPLIKVVRQVLTPEERIRYLRRVRPDFPRPKKLSTIFWPRFVGGLVRLGLYDHILERVSATGYVEAVEMCRAALKELLQLERAEVAAVVSGGTYHTVWTRNP